MAASDYTGKEKASLANIKEMIENGASLQQIRGAMGLGYSLDVLAAANGGTGVNNLQDVADAIVNAITGGESGGYNMAADLHSIAVIMAMQNMFAEPANVKFDGNVGFYNSNSQKLPVVAGKVGPIVAESTGDCNIIGAANGVDVYISAKYTGGGDDSPGSSVDSYFYLDFFNGRELEQGIAKSAFIDTSYDRYILEVTNYRTTIYPDSPFYFVSRCGKKGTWDGRWDGNAFDAASNFNIQFINLK